MELLFFKAVIIESVEYVININRLHSNIIINVTNKDLKAELTGQYHVDENRLFLNTKNGDFSVFYKKQEFIKNKLIGNLFSTRKNNYQSLYEFYNNSNIELICYKDKNILFKIKSILDYEKKDFNKSKLLYGYFLDYILNKKKIIWHDFIFNDIKQIMPSKKFLKKNNNDYIDALLDEKNVNYNWLKAIIKSKNREENNSNIKLIILFSQIFGSNGKDYMLMIINHLYTYYFPTIKYDGVQHELTKYEKLKLVDFIKNNFTNIRKNIIIFELINYLKLRDKLINSGVSFRFDIENVEELFATIKKYNVLIKREKTKIIKGYEYPTFNLNELEGIHINGENKFDVKLLKNEDDFINESLSMKNCLYDRFNDGKNTYYFSITINDEIKTIAHIGFIQNNVYLKEVRLKYNKEFVITNDYNILLNYIFKYIVDNRGPIKLVKYKIP